jgi:hypothetical protein
MTQRISFASLILLAIFCAVIGPAINQEGTAGLAFNSTRAIAQTVISGQTTIVVLPGASHSFNTNVAVVMGDIIRITATGTILNSQGDTSGVNPDGTDYCHCVFNPSLLPNISANSLIGSINNSYTGNDLLDDGYDTNPQGITGTSTGHPGLFGPGYIGSSFTGMAKSSGEIYIAYNDSFPDDNLGSFTVTITIVTKESLRYNCFLPEIAQ